MSSSLPVLMTLMFFLFLSLCPRVDLFVLHSQCLLSHLTSIFASLSFRVSSSCIACLYFNLPPLSLRTILLSVISLLNEPNTFSPANVDASVMYRKWRDSKGKDREYIEIIRYRGDKRRNGTLHALNVSLSAGHGLRVPAFYVFSIFLSRRKQVLATKADAERDGVKVPVTLDEYCVRTQVPPTDDGSNLLYDDYYDDEELEDDDEDDNEDCCYDEDDSGTEDS